MAIDEGTQALALAIKQRTKQIAIFTTLGADPELCIYRERVALEADGSVCSREDLPCIETTLSRLIAAGTDLGGGMTAAKFAGAIANAADILAQHAAEKTGPFVEEKLK